MNIAKQSNRATWVKGNPSPYQLHDLTHFPDWRNLIVWDAFFNNLTSGLMIITVIAWAFGNEIFGALLPFALTLALALVCIDLGILVADLGDPWRFTHALRVLHFTSPLSVGVWGLTSYATCLGIAVVLYWLSWAAVGTTLESICVLVARPFTVLAFIGAVVVICYKGVVFSCSSQPGVSKARWLTSFLVSDSLLMGLGAYMILAAMLGAFVSAPWLILPLFILVIARSVAYGLLWADVKERARKRFAHDLNLGLAIMVLGVGGILPLILAFFGPAAQACAGVLVLATGAAERYWFIGLTHPL